MRLPHALLPLLLSLGACGPGDAGRAASADSPGPQEPPAAAAARPADPTHVDLDTLGYTVGDPGAPLRVVEFSDFGCGYCRQFHLETWPTLRREYVETGKVRWQYVPMTLGNFGRNALEAAWAAECALEQGRFPAMQDALFRGRTEWLRARDAISVFRRLAEELGLDVERWRTCMGEGRRHDRVEAGSQLAREVGVRGTPTFFVLGYGTVPGAIPLAMFRQVLDDALAKRGATDGGP